MSRLSIYPEVSSPRLRWLRVTLLAAALLGILSCLPLWQTARAYPLVPVADWWPNLPPPIDRVLLWATLLSLIAALRFYRGSVGFFLGATLFLYLGDCNRGQPWIYMYWVMMLLTLLPEAIALAGCRLALSAVYVWTGIQKINGKYFATVPDYFARPLADLGAPAWMVQPFQWAVMAAPFIEIFIGLGLWERRLRLAALVLVTFVHVGALLVLGPLGYKYNVVVWPWNLAMIALAYVLFPANGLGDAWPALRQSRVALAVVALFWLLPTLGYWGRWDSNFCFALYSQSQALADVFLTPRARDTLPPDLQPFVHEVRVTYDPSIQGPLVFDHQNWAIAVMGAPQVPEPRVFRKLFRHVCQRTVFPDDLRMIYEPRGGQVQFYTSTGSYTLLPNQKK